MTKILIPFFLLPFIFLFLSSCDKEDDEKQVVDYAYHAHIHAPTSDAKNLNDTLEIELEFESHSGEAVHHINVRILNTTNNSEVYNQPIEAHVHELSGIYEFKDELVLSIANGFSANSNWRLEARVWGPEEGEGEKLETQEFFIN